MNKLLVTIKFPAFGIEFDAYIPKHLKVYEFIDLVGKIVDSTRYNGIVINNSTVVMDESGKILDINQTILDSGIRNGSELMLV